MTEDEPMSSNARKRARKKALKEAKALKQTKAAQVLAACGGRGLKTKTEVSNHAAASIKLQNPTSTKTTKNDKKRKRQQQKSTEALPPKATTNRHEEEDDLLAFAAAWANDSNTATAIDENSTAAAKNGSGKKKKKKKKSEETHLSKTNTTDVSNQHPPRPHNNNNSHKSLIKQLDRHPPAFRQHQTMVLPEHEFLRDQEPYQESFQMALNTAYEGLAWDPPEATLPEHEMCQALSTLDHRKLFRTDVTQPAGLGAKLVPSYVTRCLLGEEGTTYRYLGLRMFAHPWNGKHCDNNDSGSELQKALQTFQTLNAKLTENTQGHLQTLANKRQQRGESEPLVSGIRDFNVTLINKMTVHKRLREEPMFGQQKYTVGWHADSSLEHFSTIAVYHTLMATTTAEASDTDPKRSKKAKSKRHNNSNNHQSSDNEWSVALRVTHDAEGPRQKRLGDITVETTAPPIAVGFPSGYTYFMLDDYNHHHQHAVLAPDNPRNDTLRYSSTHRLLRQGHTVQDMLARCQKTLGCDAGSASSSGQHNNPRHGPKHWRSEQVLLNELENEWLRQFFVQGPEHKELLWGYWREPIEQLFRYWEWLEERTLQVVTLLQRASQAKCKQQQQQQQSSNDNHHHKKNKKNGTTVHALVISQEEAEALKIMDQIAQGGDKKNKKVLASIYNPMATHILERAKSRELWAKREVDSVFHRLPTECHPIPFPVVYGGSNKGKKNSRPSGAPTFVMAHSCMPDGSSDFLKKLGDDVKAWGEAFETGDMDSLPKETVLKLAS